LSTSVLAGPNATAGKWTYLNPADPTDFCLMLPPTKGMGIGASEGQAVSYCTNPSDAPGARQFDSAAVLLAHQVVDYKNNWIQMTGYLDNNILQIDPTPGSGGQYDDAPWGVEPTSGCLGYTRYIELVGVIPNTTRAEFCIRCCMIPNITDAFDHSVDNPCFAGHDTLGCDVDIPGDYSSPGI
ncbi:uncharacterized protein BJ171DRAFT_404806, partial [Polychytrium aggregatum]|uniref:uncharacterized protein n=1 Tax=Polychytrium aggregatum TaxID=110093 RepID=UPI0022FDDCB9